MIWLAFVLRLPDARRGWRSGKLRYEAKWAAWFLGTPEFRRWLMRQRHVWTWEPTA